MSLEYAYIESLVVWVGSWWSTRTSVALKEYSVFVSASAILLSAYSPFESREHDTKAIEVLGKTEGPEQARIAVGRTGGIIFESYFDGEERNDRASAMSLL